MTIAVWAVVIMLFGHWVADFVWQPHWMGMRKSKEWWVLLQHGLRITCGGLVTASVIFVFFHPANFNHYGITEWALLNGAAHVAIDAVTSRITGRYWAQQRTHAFFTTIGFDQFLHLAFAVVTLAWLVL